MKKVLIVSYLFAPQNKVGGIRPTKISRYLFRSGYSVSVFTASPDDQMYRIIHIGNDEDNNTIEQKKTEVINDLQNASKVNTIPGNRRSKMRHEFGILYRQLLKNMNSYRFIRQFKRCAKSKKIDINSYDVIFTTFGPIGNVLIGLYVKKHYPKVKWLCDFRDPMVTDLTPALLKPLYRFIQNRSCKLADSIIAVSKGYLERICNGKYREKAYMIPNGYDVDDMIYSINVEESRDVINITYVGALYEGKRDLSPIFHALRELIDEGTISSDQICFNYAGSDYQSIYTQARQYNMQGCLKNHGQLSRVECLKLQFSSHFLVLSTWNSKGEEGVFPGKFLEYMLIKKPVISIVDGNLPNSEVSQVMREGKLGFVYESVSENIDYPKLKEYIKSQYCSFLSGRGICFSPDISTIERYDYRAIIKQIEGLIE